MKVIERALDGVVLFEVKIFHDERGFFSETHREEWMKELGITQTFVQENHSRSIPNIIRGMHFQRDPVQGKLVSVRRGAIYDVAVDVRKGSPTYGKYFASELSATNGRVLWISPGFAHGFCVLGDEPADVNYKVTGYYNPKSEGGLRFDDPQVAVKWPLQNPQLTPKDLVFPFLKDLQPVEVRQ